MIITEWDDAYKMYIYTVLVKKNNKKFCSFIVDEECPISSLNEAAEKECEGRQKSRRASCFIINDPTNSHLLSRDDSHVLG